jgi:hypothetical protein
MRAGSSTEARAGQRAALNLLLRNGDVTPSAQIYDSGVTDGYLKPNTWALAELEAPAGPARPAR